MGVQVKDVMSAPVVTIDEEKTAKDAGQLMKKVRRGALVVLKKGKPSGIITDSDLVKRIVATGTDSAKIKIKEVMSRPLVTIHVSDDVLAAVRTMKKINVHRLPVVDETGKLAGLLSLTDVAKTSPELADLLEYKEKMREEEPMIKTETTAGICDNCENYSESLKHVEDEWLCNECIGEKEEE